MSGTNLAGCEYEDNKKLMYCGNSFSKNAVLLVNCVAAANTLALTDAVLVPVNADTVPVANLPRI